MATPSESTNALQRHLTTRELLQQSRITLPNGQEIQIVASPDEADTIRRTMSGTADIRRDDRAFDILIHGSPEHLRTLREIHSHHEAQKAELRKQFPEAYEKLETIFLDLDALAGEISKVTNREVELSANFDKYGYGAHLRTKTDVESTGPSGASTPRNVRKKSEAGRRGLNLKLWKTPVLRQYFHKGLLWRAADEEEISSFELFVDLLYVGFIAVNGDTASENPTGPGLLRFIITFIPSWKIWSDVTNIISWFETDDLFTRLAILFTMACLIGFTTNIIDAFENTYAPMIWFYMTARFFEAIYYFGISFLIPMVRGQMLVNVVATLIPCALWIGSIYVEFPERHALIWIAIAFDLWSGSSVVLLQRMSKHINKGLADKIDSWFQYFPAVNIEHKTERMNAFIGLVIGYSIVGIIYGSSASFGLNGYFGKAVLGLMQSFCFNWLYFEIDGTNHEVHAIRRSVYSALVWFSIHLPFVMGFVLSSAALSKLVVAHDLESLHKEDLTHFYAEKSEGEVPVGLRWMYCGGLAVSLASITIISASHRHIPVTRQRWRKAYRLAIRFAVSIIILLLPLAGDHLDSLELIATTAGCVVFALICEVWGSSSKVDSFFFENGKCVYETSAQITKMDVPADLKEASATSVSVKSGKEKS